MSPPHNAQVADMVTRLVAAGAPITRDPDSAGGPELPPGVRLWEPGMRPPRPVPDPGMFHGPIGRFALAAAAYTEADPVAIFAQALCAFGVAANRSSYVIAGNDQHPASLFCLIVGASAKGGKGTSWAVVRELLARLDPAMLDRVLGGFGSGEAVVSELADDDATDKRVLVFESEFGGLLARGRREGSTCSAIMRDLWDGRPLQSRTRSGGKLVATGYHAGAIGHITREELRAKLTESDLFGGFVNRWLIWWVERGTLRPDGGNVPPGLLDHAVAELRPHLAAARRGGELRRTPGAEALWHDLYVALADDDPPGLLGHAVNRSAPQCLRLSVALALADGARAITEDHVGAARLTWDYCRASAARVFGESAGSPDADKLLANLRNTVPEGLDFSQQRDLFAHKAGRAEAARDLLTDAGLAHTVYEPTAGRPRGVTYAVNRSAP
jgi:hypothetical protein